MNYSFNSSTSPMTPRAKVTSGLLATLFSGTGAYVLFSNNRGRGSLDILDQKHINENEDEDVQTKESDPKPEPKKQTYKEYLTKSNKTITFVDEKTTVDVLKNILLQRMFPHYRQNFKYSPGQIFDGSKEIQFNISEKTKDNKSLSIINKNTDNEAEDLRKACMSVLNKEKPDIKEDGQIYRIKAWCTIPTIRDNLQRHKFVIPTTTDDWKKILDSEWITQDKYHDKQSFFTSDDLKKLKGSDEAEKLKTLKDKCTTALAKPLERNNFPATKEFLGNTDADLFQETALFCTVPKTASEYVKEAMKGTVREDIPEQYKKDYCYIDGKSISDYSSIKTTDPMEGKSFWCAIRMIYHKQDQTQK